MDLTKEGKDNVRPPDFVIKVQVEIVYVNQPPLPLPRPPVPSWFHVAGFALLAITVAFLMWYVTVGPPVDPQKKTYIAVLVAFCAAGSGAFLGGDAIAKGKLPFLKQSPITFSAVGGIAIFVIVFLLVRFS